MHAVRAEPRPSQPKLIAEPKLVRTGVVRGATGGAAGGEAAGEGSQDSARQRAGRRRQGSGGSYLTGDRPDGPRIAGVRLVALALALSGCADFETRSAPVASISAQDYEHYECNQIAVEARAVAQRAARLWRVEPVPNRADAVVMPWPGGTFFGDRNAGNELQRPGSSSRRCAKPLPARTALALRVQSG